MALFGGTPEVERYHPAVGDYFVDMIVSVDQPQAGVSSWGTVGMSQFDTHKSADDLRLRVELLGCCSSEVTEFGAMLSTCAFNVASGDYSISPGAIYPDIVKAHAPDVNMKHMMFVPVFLWELPAEPLLDAEVIVTWLQAVPVSEAGFEFAREHGSDALQSQLEAADVDVFNLQRPSAVPEPELPDDPWATG